MSAGWSWFVIALVVSNIVGCVWLIWWTGKRSPGAMHAQRVAVRPDLLERLGAILKEQDIEELSLKLEAAGLPYAPIVRPEQLIDDPHLRASGGLVQMQTEDGGMTDVVLLPLTMGGRRPGVRTPLPRIGEHTEEVLSQLRGRQGGDVRP